MSHAHRLVLLAWWSLTLVVLTLAAAAEPSLSLRASPPVVMAGREVLLTAELHGEEREDWYCPAVKWRFPDGTEGGCGSSVESDCPPFEERDDYPRRWTCRVRPGEGTHVFWVELSKAGKRKAAQSVTVEVR